MLKVFKLLGVTILVSLLLITAVACKAEYRLHVIVASGQGQVTPSSGTYTEGTRVTIAAIPDSGWDFSHWEGSISGSDNPTHVQMRSNKIVEAYFVETQLPTPTSTPTPTPETTTEPTVTPVLNPTVTSTPTSTPTTTSTPTITPVSSPTPTGTVTSLYPVMHFTEEELVEMEEAYNNASVASITPQEVGQEFPKSFSLLPYLNYTPWERKQGDAMGNCWVWAGTGVMEIALNVEKHINSRLSIQYFDSNYKDSWAGCGGTLEQFANFYKNQRTAIPWSNTNAYYHDSSNNCSYPTTVPASSIGLSPSYLINHNIEVVTISTSGVGQATAITNIKNILNQNKSIWVSFGLPDYASWKAFNDFWYNQSESAIWTSDTYCGRTWTWDGAKHAVLCVGYDDSDPNPANHYWLMLNSWGTTTGRPNGLFRVQMHSNYGCTFYTFLFSFPITAWYWQTLENIYPVVFPTTTPTPTPTATSIPTPTPISQHIEYDMAAGANFGSWVYWSKYLTTGEQVTGTVSLTGTNYGYDWDYTWSCEVLNPQDNTVSTCYKEWNEGTTCNINFTASQNGNYKIKISNVSFWTKHVTIDIQPYGWD